MIAIQSNLFPLDIDTQGDTDQRYTPPEWVWRVTRAIGLIDLDPTAQPSPDHWIAQHNITEAMDTFATDWAWFNPRPMRLFMNPPYSNTTPFMARWAEYFANYPMVGITLTLPGVLHNRANQCFLRRAIEAGTLRSACHPTGRINFVGGGKSNDRDSLLLYWNSTDNPYPFADVFAAHGIISHFGES